MFIVNCVRLRKHSYALTFDIDIEAYFSLKDNIKSLDKWDYVPQVGFKLKTLYLYQLIHKYKGNADIKFHFNDIDRTKFIIDKDEAIQALADAKAKLNESLERQNKNNQFKEYLKNNVHILDFKSFLKENVVPYSFQTIGAYFLKENKGGLLAMDLGTGKSITSLLASEMLEDAKKVIIIVPNSLKINWLNEINKFTNSKGYVVDIKEKKINGNTKPEDCKYIITNYEYYRSKSFDYKNFSKKYGFTNIDYCILDEAHRITNTNTLTYKGINSAFRKISKGWILATGTPITNKIESLYTLLQILSPYEFTNKTKFLSDYCNIRWKDENYTPPNFEMIYNKLSGLMYRVKKNDVLKDLPKVSCNKVIIQMTTIEENEYYEIESGFSNVDWSLSSITDTDNQASPLVILGRLSRYTSMIKTKRAIEMIQELNDEGEKVVVFDIFKKSLKKIHEVISFTGYNGSLYTGEIDAFQRQELVDKFQEDNNDLMNLYCTAAGNVGITLTNSCNLIQLTQDYNPALNEQAYARINRIGQKRPCNIFILIVNDTIDERVYSINNRKNTIINKAIDNVDFVNIDNTTAIQDILNEFKIKYKK